MISLVPRLSAGGCSIPAQASARPVGLRLTRGQRGPYPSLICPANEMRHSSSCPPPPTLLGALLRHYRPSLARDDLLSPSKHPYVQGWLHEGRTSTGSFVLSWRSVMNRGPVWLAAMIIGIVAGYLSVSAAAQSPASKGQHCPAGYSLVASVCVNSDGDVVEPR
jgi:hypothetical protein